MEILDKHHWIAMYFDPKGKHNGITTCTIEYSCEECHRIEILPLNATPSIDGCIPKPREKVKRPNLQEMEDQKRFERGREVPLKGRR